MQNRRRILSQRRKQKKARRQQISQQLKNWTSLSDQRRKNQQYNSILAAYANVLRIMGSSWDLDTFIKLEVGSDWSAATDFKDVYLTVPALEEASDGTLTGPRGQDIVTMIETFLTLGYHELGHCLFSVPFPELLALANEEGGLGLSGAGSTQLAWNALEDQRMENAMIQESPDLANYFKVGTMEAINLQDPTVYLLLIGRWWLPTEYRNLAKANLLNHLQSIDMDPSVIKKAEAIVYRYITATTAKQMITNIHAYRSLLMSIQSTGNFSHNWNAIDSHSTSKLTYDDFNYDEAEQGDSRPDESDTARETIKKTGKQASKSLKEGQKQSMAPGDKQDEQEAPAQGMGDIDTPDSEEEGSAEGTDSNDGDSGSGSGNKEAGEGSSPEKAASPGTAGPATEDLDLHEWSDPQRDEAEKLAQEEIQRAKDSLHTHLKPLLQEFQKAYHNEQSGDFKGTTMASTMPSHVVAYAEGLAASMARAFESSVANNHPSWSNRTSSGVLNAFQYKTRQSGERNFYRQREDDKALGADIAVTLVLDNSGSMDGQVGALSIMAYVVARACEMIGTKSRILLFNSQTYLMKDWDESPYPGQITATGGTDPMDALRSLPESAPEDASHHLALVMTDGEFWLEDEDTKVNYGDTHVLGYLYEPRMNDLGEWYQTHAREQFEEVGIFNAKAIGTLQAMVDDVESYVLGNLH